LRRRIEIIFRHKVFNVLLSKGKITEDQVNIPDEPILIYQSKDGKEEKVFDALEWLTAIPACA